MEMFVKSENCKAIALDVKARDNIDKLKATFFEITGTPPNTQHFSFEGRQLVKGTTLFDRLQDPGRGHFDSILLLQEPLR